MTSKSKFSTELTSWLSNKEPKTIGSMLHVFDEKSFAFVFLVLMIFPASPLPTGGITHVFEVVVILLALQLVVGRRHLWLPKKLRNMELDRTTRTKILPFLLRRVQFFERFAKPRLHVILRHPWFRMANGLVIVIFTLGAFLAPPFTGLDTLPSLGVVLISIGIILDDFLIAVLGYIVGLVGLAITLVLGIGIVTAIEALFK